jgi:hypothetical protein
MALGSPNCAARHTRVGGLAAPEIVRRADAALYHAKNNDRNRAASEADVEKAAPRRATKKR